MNAVAQRRLLVIASVLSVVLFTFHLTDDIVRGIEEGNWSNLPAIPIAVAWLCGALVLPHRRLGHVLMLLGALLALVVPVLHMRGAGVGVGGRVPTTEGAWFFIWTLLALGVTGLFSIILAVRALFSWKSAQSESGLQ